MSLILRDAESSTASHLGHTSDGRRVAMSPTHAGLFAWCCVLLVLGGPSHIGGNCLAWAYAEGGGGGDGGREHVEGPAAAVEAATAAGATSAAEATSSAEVAAAVAKFGTEVEEEEVEEEEVEEEISIRRRRRNQEHQDNLEASLEALFNTDNLFNSDSLGYLALKFLVRWEFPILNFVLTNVLAAFVAPPPSTCPGGW